MFRIPILHRYLLREFFGILFVCLLAAVSLFLVVDLFERIGAFITEKSSLFQVLSYLFYKIPLVIHLMMPVAVLVATILAVGRLSQLSEITAMRACGASVISLSKPLLLTGLFISCGMMLLGETVLPWASQRVDEIYNVDIKKKVEKGTFSRSNFWYRSKNRFLNIGLYDSSAATLQSISMYEFDDAFRLLRRTDAREATWAGSSRVGWIMKDVIEISVDTQGKINSSAFSRLPLVIDEQPTDFYNMEKKAETLSFPALRKYIDKLRHEGVSVTSYQVDLAAKLSFPFVSFVVVLIGIPFSLIPARSGSLAWSFVAGVTIAFGYYVVHAISVSLGKAELLPILGSVWTANIVFGSIGGYLLAGAEQSEGLV